MSERDQVYSCATRTAITPNDDDVQNIKGAKLIHITGNAGNVVFKNRDGDATAAVPLAANQTYSPCWDEVSIMATNTTATGIQAYWGPGVDPVTG